jgi:kynurenine formamidase
MTLENLVPVDLSVPVAPEYPVWPGNPVMTVEGLWTLDEPPYCFNRVVSFDEHAGTHWDAPSHFVRDPAARGLPATETVPLERLIAPACVLDATGLAGAAGPGESPIFGRDRVLRWEREHRPIEEGDAVLLHTGWTDAHYRTGEAGRLYAQAVIDGETAAWAGLDVEAMTLLVERGVGLFGTDTPSAGPMQEVVEVHRIGLGAGIVFVENLIGLHQLPATGAWLVFLPLKLVGGSGAPGRAVALVPREGVGGG